MIYAQEKLFEHPIEIKKWIVDYLQSLLHVAPLCNLVNVKVRLVRLGCTHLTKAKNFYELQFPSECCWAMEEDYGTLKYGT